MIHILPHLLTTPPSLLLFFFFKAPPTTEIYTLSLHDALPISHAAFVRKNPALAVLDYAEIFPVGIVFNTRQPPFDRSEEHTSELQSHHDLVCRLLLEKKKKKKKKKNKKQNKTNVNLRYSINTK